ncbi:uncharacterized protein LOC128200694 [Galleria mellonella]|uniref:Uncharacterized protein LOC128200694 n=1 Tax=Galleria mellonella TaxID=7137 RepID=A0ABM3MHL8_GALME|nr:uncharacterized protein LOC128200694 [Galleria mellonella]
MLFGGSLTFDHRSQEWGIFKSRFIQYCTANDINDGSDKSGVKRRALLLTALVEDTYRVARDIVFPTPLENEEFKLLLEKLDTHFCEKKSTFAERYQFYKAEQRVGEELAEWAARVRHLAQYCGFKTELDTALRDRFILGLENVKEKEKLFAESIDTLTFNNALEIAQRVRCSRLALQSSRADTGTAHQQQPVYALHTGIGRTGTPAAPVAPAARSRPARTASQKYRVIFLIKKYEKLFRNELGTFNKYRVHLKIKPDIQLKFFKARPVPLALKHKVEGELQRLSDLGILERVEHSEFATPIVPVLRSDGGIRICGDFSVTLNKALFMDNYPLPRIEDLFAKLHGGLQFSKLDLSRAYNQLELDDSKYLTCINTHKGLFIYNRLVFGLSNAPSIFQRTMEQLLGDIEGTCIFLDDILITGSTKEEHLNRLEQVLWRLQEAGLRLKREKCDLFKDCVEYLGFRIDKNGLHKSESKVNAIINSNCPKNVTELKSFLGMINYYRCFVPNTSSVLSPLHALLKKGTKWTWGKEQNGAFNKIKSELSSDRVLAHYSPEYQTIVTADAGPQGLGAVLAQRQPDGTERVVAYASRSLSNSEQLNCHVKKHVDQLLAYKGTDLSQDLDDISLSDYYPIVGEGTDRNMREETVSSEVVCQPIVPEGAITNPDVCAPELPETSSSSQAEFSHDDSFVSIPDHNSVGTTAEQTTSTPLSLLPIENDPQEKQISVPSTSALVPTPVTELRGHQNDHTMVTEAEPTVIKRGRNPIRSTRMKKVNYKL